MNFAEFQSSSSNGIVQIKNTYLKEVLQKFSFYNSTDDIEINTILQKKVNNQIIVINSLTNPDEDSKTTELILCFDYKLFIIQFSQILPFLSLNNSSIIYFLSNNIKYLIEKTGNITFPTLDEKESKNFEHEIDNFIKNSRIIYKYSTLDQLNYWKTIFRCIFGFLIQKAKANSKSNRIKNYENYFFSSQVQKENFIEDELIELRLLGVGISSHVLLHYSLIKEKIYATKILIDEDEEEREKLFERERNYYMNIHHPLFPRYFGSISIGPYKYCLILEYLEGKTLNEIKKFKKEDEIKIIFQLMLIFEYLHYNEFVYRDLKPNNLIIDENSSVYLIDFGRMRKINDTSDNQFTQLCSIYYDGKIASDDPLSQKLDISSLEKIITNFFSEEFGATFSKNMKKLDNIKSNSLMISNLFDAFYSEHFSKIKPINEFYTLITNDNINFHDYLLFPLLFLLSEYQNNEAQLILGHICEYSLMIARKGNEHYFYITKDINSVKYAFPNNPNLIFTKIDLNKAIYYYTLSANQNNFEAQYRLGLIYCTNHEIFYDIKNATHCLTLAADLIDLREKYYLGQINFINIPPDYGKAIYYLQPLADQNYLHAPYLVGMIYKSQGNINKAIHYLTLSANQNNSESLLQLGFIYEEGRYVSKNINKAINYYIQSAKLNNSAAFNSLGLLYYDGFYVKQDIQKAIYYYSLAAKLNNKHGLFNLANIYLEGKYTQQDVNKAIHYYELAANQNLIKAQSYLGFIYSSGQYIQRDIKKSIYYYDLAAKQNDVMSQYNIGYLYYDGKYIKRDINKAIYYFQLAADQNCLRAQKILVCIFYYGLYIAKDFNRAFYYLKLAVEQNDSEFQWFLGRIYKKGRHIKRDIKKAIYYFELSSNQKNEKASYFLGNLYLKGKHVQRDIKKAIYYYQLSANQYFPLSLNALGKLYYNGEYVPKDINKSIYYFQLSANQNDDLGQYYLGSIFYLGLSGKMDIKKGIYYLGLSADKGFSLANFKMGFIYHQGKNIKRDILKAIYYYKNASSFNDKYSKNNLGVIYRYGFGEEVPKMLGLAIEYLKEAVNKSNDCIAMFNLAHIYLFEPNIIENNLDICIDLLIKSSIKGFVNSKILLSLVLILKYKYDINKIKSKVFECTDKTSKLPFEVCEFIIKLRCFILCDSHLETYKKACYLYNDELQPFPSFILMEEKDNKTSETNNIIRDIDHQFYEAFGLKQI